MLVKEDKDIIVSAPSVVLTESSLSSSDSSCSRSTSADIEDQTFSRTQDGTMKAVRSEENPPPKRPERRKGSTNKKVKMTLAIKGIHRPGDGHLEQENTAPLKTQHPTSLGQQSKEDQDQGIGMSMKLKEHEGDQTSRLRHIINSERTGNTKVDHASQTLEPRPLQTISEGKKSPSISFFARGSLLVSSVRNSFRNMAKKKTPFQHLDNAHPSTSLTLDGHANDSGINDLSIKGRAVPPQPQAITRGASASITTTKTSCNESQDSGLGEESDFDPASHSSLVRTPTPITVTTTQTSSLRKISSVSSSVSGGAVVKKHVIIREPSLSILPSSRKRRVARLETVRIYPRATRLPSIAKTGTVSPIWDQLNQSACAEVLRAIPLGDSFTIKLMFSPDRAQTRDDVQDLDTIDDIARLILTVYRVLFYEWIQRKRTTHLAIILHCVQHFLVTMVDLASHMDVDDRLRFARICGDLVRESEMGRYKDLGAVLLQTRTVYIDLWCAMLCLPTLSPLESPSLSEVRKRLMKQRRSFFGQDD
ncbi:hypothetical protein TCAL_14356 [Tigriopus californicus]|uniref:Uncharacterized protein n=1 Tax=Tigriopus californicus TaxID=6832 RepID=A0A553NBY2_TIGCA|nr:uncharacterized protein LOC131888585 [Tigriopus californicus]XP_059093456.1 uncharacterized protein LOC131888585 [Tigriopus californicus]TRY62927.1 hypothetical protein TCAL_14356 [Tigriopus californicus]